VYLEFENDRASETLAFAAEMNKATDAVLHDADFEADRDAIRALIERDDKLIISTRRGDYLYNFRKLKSNPLGVWQRLPVAEKPLPSADWETIFDLDAFCKAAGKTWVWRGAVTCSWEPERVLLQLSDGGSDLMRFVEFDCGEKAVVSEGFDLPPVRAHASWLSRDEILYFGSIDRYSATKSSWPRVGRVLRRGQKPEEGVIVFEGADEAVTAYGGRMGPELAGLEASGEVINYYGVSHTIGSNSFWFDKNGGERLALDIPRRSDVSVNHQYCLWRAKSDERVAEGSLVLQPLPVHFDGCPPSLDGPRVLFSPADRQTVQYFTLLRQWCIFSILDNLRPRVFLLNLDEPEGEPVSLDLPDGAETFGAMPLYADQHLGDDTLTAWTQGFLQPQTLYALSLSGRSPSLKLEQTAEAPALFDATGMRSELLEAVSEDGTRVPYRLVLPKDVKSGHLPVLVYGYGGFESGLSPYYSGVIGRWLEQGNGYVQAYIRGGDEYGPGWHMAAKRENRPRAYEDFAAIARDLVKRGYSRPDTIACQGGSNGGLLTGVMLTRYPEDFGAVWCQVPVLDMLRYNKFPAGQAWVDEYGDPDVEEDARYLKAYSPIHNVADVKERAYPPVYVESSSNDDRVHPSHARRFASLLRDNGQNVLFREFGSGGHGGDGSAGDIAGRVATGYSFLRSTIVRNSKG
jgi:prolyl oligopeptidase